MSINDRPDIRDIFTGFRYENVELNYSVAGGEGVPARELIVSSFDI
ncbi:hypothetical protein LVY75_25625 [Sinorhizobium sp. B11]